MPRLPSLFRNSRPDTSPPSEEALAFHSAQLSELNDALSKLALLMNDDADKASELLKKTVNEAKEPSSFHLYSLSLVLFFKSILGFEKDIMAEAVEVFGKCETQASADLKKAQKFGRGQGRSSVYPAGTEYELIRAEVELMGAVVGVLHESIGEAIRGVYKVRKAYIALSTIVENERKAREEGVKSKSDDFVVVPEKLDEGIEKLAITKDAEDSEWNDDFVDAKEQQSGTGTPLEPPVPSPFVASGNTSKTTLTNSDPNELQFTHPLDIFTHTGSNLDFGFLIFALSLVPPAFSKILSIVGFHGDRVKGLKMMWRAAAVPTDTPDAEDSKNNIHAALTAMMLFSYYNTLLGTVDITPPPAYMDDPSAETFGRPKARIDALLQVLRQRYPDSQMWRIEEARAHASEKDLPRALDVLQNAPTAKTRQVTALRDFELSITTLSLHRWGLMRDAAIRSMEVNDWSPTVYLYLAGCASLELYRDARQAGDEDEARREGSKAEKYLTEAPKRAGKKKLMARQLPIETFVTERVARWEKKSKELGISLVDCVGSSPAMEFCYIWNGPKRMSLKELQKTLDVYSWDRLTCPEDAREKVMDLTNRGVWAIGVAATRRWMGDMSEARGLLQDNVLNFQRSDFDSQKPEDYVYPLAIYELAAQAWAQCVDPPRDLDEAALAAFQREQLDECEKQLLRVKQWGAYSLDARTGMKIQSGLETVRWFKQKKGL